ncbi:MAG TPA: tetratricopeptide repeat protein [Chthoniobacteraceae bacterium]|jgi:tetratricopeptide (TPR) repeat protein|nr:tetratricopeptide repeat protein [Chthoniobacteraceae bacterium]
MKTTATTLLAASLIALSGSAPACLQGFDLLLKKANNGAAADEKKGATTGGKKGAPTDGKKGAVAEEPPLASRDYLLSHTHDHEYWVTLESELRPGVEPPAKPALTKVSDYSVVLAHLGEYEKSRRLLEEAEQKHPGNAAVASNLGTVYELLGENEKALKWIKKGIERNPKDHAGTEWLHVRILTAKVALAKDPKWLEAHRVLEPYVDYGQEAHPSTSNPAKAKERSRALAYQLKERLEFVKAPEPIVGELLFSLANELTLSGAVEPAVGVYELAAEYEPMQADLLKKRTEHAKEVVRKWRIINSTPPNLLRLKSF